MSPKEQAIQFSDETKRMLIQQIEVNLRRKGGRVIIRHDEAPEFEPTYILQGVSEQKALGDLSTTLAYHIHEVVTDRNGVIRVKCNEFTRESTPIPEEKYILKKVKGGKLKNVLETIYRPGKHFDSPRSDFRIPLSLSELPNTTLCELNTIIKNY